MIRLYIDDSEVRTQENMVDKQHMIEYLNSVDDETDDINIRISRKTQNRIFVDNLIRTFNSDPQSEDHPSCTDIDTVGKLYDIATLFHKVVVQTKERLMEVASVLSLETLMNKYIEIEDVSDDLHRWSLRFFNLVNINIIKSMVSQEFFYRYSIDEKLFTLATFADFYEYLSEQSVEYNKGEDVVDTNNECFVMDIITYQRNN